MNYPSFDLEMDYDKNNPLPFLEPQQAFEKYFDQESVYMADAAGYFDSENILLREHALHFIVKAVQNSKNNEKYDDFIPYLAMNYFDRLVSRTSLLEINEMSDDIRLIAFCCLTIAWKICAKTFHVNVLLDDLNKRIISEKGTEIVSMEISILRRLDWKIRAVTSFSFLSFFLPLESVSVFNSAGVHNIILLAQGDIKFTRFKPSTITASALLAASWILSPGQYLILEAKLKSIRYVNEDDLRTCTKELLDLCKSKRLMAIRDPPKTTAEMFGSASECYKAGSSASKEQTEQSPDQRTKQTGKGKVDEIQENMDRIEQMFSELRADDKKEKASGCEIEEDVAENESKLIETDVDDWLGRDYVDPFANVPFIWEQSDVPWTTVEVVVEKASKILPRCCAIN